MSTKTARTTRTPEEVRRDFEERGVNVAEFARDHGLCPATVYQLLAGTKKGRRGMAHRAAVVLGLKAGVIPPARRRARA